MTAPLRVCAEPRCPTLTSSRYCDQHRRALKVEHTRFHSGGGFYGRPWRRARAAFLAEHPFCAQCPALATEVDHIIPHRGDRDLFWDQANWQALCDRCHGQKTAAETLHGRT
jgi:5-methylcytosine-specific restriction protein A